MEAKTISDLLEAAGIASVVPLDEHDGTSSPVSAPAGGAVVVVNDSTNEKPLSAKEQLMEQMEAWLGIPPTATKITMANDHDINGSSSQNYFDNDMGLLRAQDCSPMPTPVYHHWKRLLLQAWQADGSETLTLVQHNKTQKSSSQSSPVPPTRPPGVPYENLLLEKVTMMSSSPTSQHREIASLASVWDSLRATRWLRHWMELDLEIFAENQQSDAYDDTENDTTTIRQEQQQEQQPLEYHWAQLFVEDGEENDTSSVPAVWLIQALYHHIQQLPTLQAHMHAYTHWLQQPPSEDGGGGRSRHRLGTTTGTNSGAGNSSRRPQQLSPHERLQWFQQAQAVAARLLEEWNQHVENLQQITALWYRIGGVDPSGRLRIWTKHCFGRVWTRYLIRNAPTSSSTSSNVMVTRHENTQAAGISITLQVLFCILAGGSSSSNKSENDEQQQRFLVDQHLLTQFLIPLHQPNALVLWRDQTPVMSLYHEPLVQCIAAILQRHKKNNHENSTTTSHYLLSMLVQSLIQPEIFAPGNTNKQVLLLHEIDTYLGLFSVPQNKEDKEHETNNEESGLSAGDDITMLLQTMNKTRSSRGSEVQSLSAPTWFIDFCRVLTQSMASDHSGLAEQALQMAKNAVFCELVRKNANQCLPLFLTALVPKAHQNPHDSFSSTTSSASWNPTVRKMTYLVLKKLADIIPNDEFEKIANLCLIPTIHSTTALPRQAKPQQAPKVPGKKNNARRMMLPPSSRPGLQQPPKATSGVKSSSSGILGTSWKPPPSASGRLPRGGTRSTPPLKPGRGVAPMVAPWASKSSPPGASASSSSSTSQPPVTITGVAPWAMKPPSAAKPRQPMHLQQKRHLGEGDDDHKQKDQSLSLSGISEDLEEEMEEDSHGDDEEDVEMKDHDVAESPESKDGDGMQSGYERLMAYMEKIKPKEEEGGISSWSKTQMAETPTLLPTLKLHDLVFGHDLGSGSFGTVRYARLIDRNKTRSKWAEYAVKVVSTDKIKELGYEASIQREIAVLRILSHPGIARLVSSFRFREGAYLVLEYASKGDLYTLLRQQGSLDHDATRFVVGEIVAALASIHDIGLVYGDLKPENIVITEVGHIKLTDFGGCRPFTPDAKSRVRKIAANALRDLRDGDWKASAHTTSGDPEGDAEMVDNKSPEKSSGGEEAEAESDFVEDSRVEGTTAYLPPEVVLGAIPTPSADTWALGCVMYQCLAGRPPLLDVDDDATRHRIVSFDTGSTAMDQVDELFQDKHSLNISPSARALIRKALNREPSQRPGMEDIASDGFFTSEETSVFELHGQTAKTLEVGTVAPAAADAQWARRQFSSIWAPQPAQYNVSLDGNQTQQKKYKTALAALAASPIPEGDEATAFYSNKAAAQAQNSMATNTMPPPPPVVARGGPPPSSTTSSLNRIVEQNPLPSG